MNEHLRTRLLTAIFHIVAVIAALGFTLGVLAQFWPVLVGGVCLGIGLAWLGWTFGKPSGLPSQPATPVAPDTPEDKPATRRKPRTTNSTPTNNQK
jgi:hypothetical protein